MDVKVHNEGGYRFGPFVVNPAKRELLRDGEPIALSYRLFETLLFLVRNPGRILSKDELFEAIWPGRYVEESSLTQAIFTLRKALGDSNQTQYIVTAPGRGYSFAAPVEQFVPSCPDPIPEEQSGRREPAGPTAVPSPAAVTRKRPSVAIVAATTAFAVLLAGTLTLYWRNHTSQAPIKAKNIVLADFQNLTNDPSLGVVLGKVLQIELAQSPYLNLLTPQRVGETLQQMERPKDAPLAPELAQEVCARNQADAVISGTVARVGARYLVTLEAKDCVQGAVIMAAQAIPGSEEDLPGALGGMTLKVREALRETDEAIRRFDVPIAQATTASFAALKSYSLGERLRAHGDSYDAMQAFKHALELDPTFALAWLQLGNCYVVAGEFDMANEAFRRAFAFRDHATEYQRFQLTGTYYSHLGDWVEGEKTYRLWTQTYPNDWLARASLAAQLINMTRYGDAIEAGRMALRLSPDHYGPYSILVQAYQRASRFSEAKAVAALATRKGVDNSTIHDVLYVIAYAEGDARTMAAEVAREKGRPTEPVMITAEARAAATSGQLRRSEALFAQAVALARPLGPDYVEQVSGFYGDEIEAVEGLASRAEAVRIAAAMTAPEKAALEVHAMARLGEYKEAASTAEDRATRSPDNGDAIEQANTLAEIDLGENRPADALAVLKPAIPYELWDFETPALLGRAWLALGVPDRAAAEYRKILANRGVDPNSPLYPLAYLGLARALHMERKDADSRAAYKQLFAFWKNADNDLPILLQAKAEYSGL